MKKMEWKFIKRLENGATTITSVEKKIEYSFPEEFRDVVLKHNGGRPRPGVVRLAEGSEHLVNRLFSFNSQDKSNILKMNENSSDFLRENYVIFADDGFGNYYAFFRRNAKISFYDAETDTAELVADTFADFLKALH
jgi:hypothetical protein